MREIWVKADPWNKELVTVALEEGADAVAVSSDRVADVRELGLIQTISDSDESDMRWEEDVATAQILSSEDEEKILALSREKKVIVKTVDWSVIPLENLIAQTKNIFVEVDSLEAARTASGILEAGVNGLLIAQEDPMVVRRIIKDARSVQNAIKLAPFKIESVRALGMGDRVCIDTCTLMGQGEGMLVGNSSRSLFLIHSESLENPYVSPRPFRVNAGAVHAYVLAPNGRTRYLSELRAGDELERVGFRGETAPVVVGRVKIEKRPLLLVNAVGPCGPAEIILQNAETIRLVRPEGEAASVVHLKSGDEVLGFAEEGARHFGHKIEETIIER